MNKFNFKSLFAVLLTVLMVFSIVPMSVSAEETTATISFASTENRVTLTTEQQVWNQNGITVTNDKAASKSNVADYSNPARFYAGSNLTVAYPGMTKIVVACNASKYVTPLQDSLGAVENITVTASGNDVTIVPTTAIDSLTFALTAQVRVNSITVYTGSTEGGETPETPETPADPEANSTLTVQEAIALGESKDHNTYTEGKYYVVGEITEVYNTQYGNMKIKDAEGNILTVYGTYSADGSTRYDAMDVKPVAGDTVKVYGIIGQFNGTAQIKNGWIVEHTPAETPVEPDPKPADPTPDTTLTIKDALALGASKDHNTYTDGKYYVVGEITEVYNTQYGNMKIKDAEGNILTVYGTYSADGSTRYDAMDVKPVAGDTVKVYGIVGQFNGTAQIKNGWIVEHTPAETPETNVPETNVPKTGDVMIVLVSAVLLAGAAITLIARKRRCN